MPALLKLIPMLLVRMDKKKGENTRAGLGISRWIAVLSVIFQ